MRLGLAVLALQVALGGSLAGCTSGDSGVGSTSAGDGGGPSFIQLPSAQDGLVGASAQFLTAEFGRPALLRTDGTAQVWLYYSGGCGLNLILYPDGGGTPRVALAAPAGGGRDVGSCAVALQRAHADGGLLRPAMDEASAGTVLPSPVPQAAIQPVSAPVMAQPEPAAPGPAAPGPAAPEPVAPMPGPALSSPALEGPSSS